VLRFAGVFKRANAEYSRPPWVAGRHSDNGFPTVELAALPAAGGRRTVAVSLD